MRSVTINTGYSEIAMPDNNVYNGPVTITLTDTQFATLSGSPLLTNGTLTDNGEVANPGDGVNVQGALVTAPAALTSVQNATAAATDLPTSEALANALKVSYNALQADVVALRATVAALTTALEGTGKALA